MFETAHGVLVPDDDVPEIDGPIDRYLITATEALEIARREARGPSAMRERSE
jgi:hypothetical protein